MASIYIEDELSAVIILERRALSLLWAKRLRDERRLYTPPIPSLLAAVTIVFIDSSLTEILARGYLL